jgi:hypothetical protein
MLPALPSSLNKLKLVIGQPPLSAGIYHLNVSEVCVPVTLYGING